MEAKLGEITEAVVRGDADRLLAHGRFLADRFGDGGGQLRIDGDPGHPGHPGGPAVDPVDPTRDPH